MSVIARVIETASTSLWKKGDRRIQVEIRGCGHIFDVSIPLDAPKPVVGQEQSCISCRLPDQEKTEPSGATVTKLVGATRSKRRSGEYTKDSKSKMDRMF